MQYVFIVINQDLSTNILVFVYHVTEHEYEGLVLGVGNLDKAALDTKISSNK